MENINFTSPFLKHIIPTYPCYHFFYIAKIVYDFNSYTIFTFKQFKNKINLEIKEEIIYQKKLDTQINEAKQNPPYEENGFAEACLIDSQRREKKLRRLLDKCSFKDSPKIDIQKAKEYPIKELMEFKGNFARCIWHNEETPSLKYYPKTNTVHCFSCQKNGDSIDAVQQLNNCDFLTAVKFLLK